MGLKLRFSAAHLAAAENRIVDAGSCTNSGAATALLFQERTSGWSQVAILPAIAELEMPWHSISERIQWPRQPTQVSGRARAWYTWTTHRGMQSALLGYPKDVQLQLISDFTIYGFQYGFGSGRPVRGSTIAATLHGTLPR